MENKPWLSNYPPDVPANINADKYENVVDFVNGCLEKHGSKVGFENMGKTLTYRQ